MTGPYAELPTQARVWLEQLEVLSPYAAGVFLRQWHEIRGSWELSDWTERIALTIQYWETILEPSQQHSNPGPD